MPFLIKIKAEFARLFAAAPAHYAASRPPPRHRTGQFLLRRKAMRIGVPKEIKIHEYRVGLVPAAVRELVGSGHEVQVETGAGAGIGVSDDNYRAAGARIAPDAQSVFAAAELI